MCRTPIENSMNDEGSSNYLERGGFQRTEGKGAGRF